MDEVVRWCPCTVCPVRRICRDECYWFKLYVDAMSLQRREMIYNKFINY